MADGAPIGLLLALTYGTAITYPSQTVGIILNSDDRTETVQSDASGLILNSDDRSATIENEVI